MQNFWDSVITLEAPDDYDTHRSCFPFLLNYFDDIYACLLNLLALIYSEMSMSQYVASDGTEHLKSAYPSLGLGNSFSFKLKDHKGRVHRFNYGKCLEFI